MRILQALLALATFSLPFSYALTLNVGFPLKIYEVCLILATPLYLLLGQWRYALRHWHLLLVFSLFMISILFTLFYRVDHPGIGFDPASSENRFSPFIDSGLKIGYAGLNFLGFFLFSWYAGKCPQRFLNYWIYGAVASATYSLYAAGFSSCHLPVFILPGVEVVQYYDDYIIRNGTFLEGNYSGLYYLISGVMATRQKKWWATAILAAGVVSSLSTTSILMLLMTAVILLAYQLRHLRVVVLVATVVNLVLLVGLGLAIVGHTQLGEKMIRKLTDSQPGINQSDIAFSRDNRWDTATTALRIFADQPMVGVGIAQYSNYYLHKTRFPISTWVPQRVIPNNVYAEILGETGLLGSVPFFLGIGMIFLAVWRARDFYFLLALGEILIGWNAFPTFSIMYVWAFLGGAIGLLKGMTHSATPEVAESRPAEALGKEEVTRLAMLRRRRSPYFTRRQRTNLPQWSQWIKLWPWFVGGALSVLALLIWLGNDSIDQSEAATNTPPPGFIMGITGQAPEQEIYKEIPPERQMQLLQELGLNWYRVAWSDQSTPEQIDRILDAASSSQVHLLPVLTPRIDLTQDRPLEDYERAAESFARKWVGRYAGRLQIWELGNELDNAAILQRGDWDAQQGTTWNEESPDGSEPNQYEAKRLARALAVLKGLSQGVASVEPDAVRLIGTAGWKHYGFLQAVEAAGIPYEIISWHWYSEMGTLTDADGTNVLQQLASFHRDIWITESGRRDGSILHHEQEQADYYAQDFYRMVRAYPQIKAYFVYELLDEPALGLSNGEAYYGLVKVEAKANGTWQVTERKPAFRVIQQESEWLKKRNPSE